MKRIRSYRVGKEKLRTVKLKRQMIKKVEELKLDERVSKTQNMSVNTHTSLLKPWMPMLMVLKVKVFSPRSENKKPKFMYFWIVIVKFLTLLKS